MRMPRGESFSVVIPTLQRADELRALVDLCAAHPLVGEVLVVNNAPAPLHWDSGKVRVLQQRENIYVNPAWNLGVRESTFPLLAILNDDILFPPQLFDHVRPWLRLPGIGIIGGGRAAASRWREGRGPRLRPVYERPPGFGVAMFMRRSNYKEIPESIRIWFGDDWLFYRQRGRNLTLCDAGIETAMSVTSEGFSATSIPAEDTRMAEQHEVLDGPFRDRFRREAMVYMGLQRVATMLRDRRR